MSRISVIQALLKFAVGLVEQTNLLQQLGPCIAGSQRESFVQPFFNSQLSRLVGAGSVVSSRRHISEFRKWTEKLLPLNSAAIQIGARGQSHKRIRHVGRQKVYDSLVSNRLRRKVLSRHRIDADRSGKV